MDEWTDGRTASGTKFGELGLASAVSSQLGNLTGMVPPMPALDLRTVKIQNNGKHSYR